MAHISHHNINNPDLVAKWEVPLNGKVHLIEFEHGTTSGKRVIYVDAKVRFISFKFFNCYF